MISSTLPPTAKKRRQQPIQPYFTERADLDAIRTALKPSGYQLFKLGRLPVWHIYDPSKPMPRRVFVLSFRKKWQFQPVAGCCDRAFEELRLTIFHALFRGGASND